MSAAGDLTESPAERRKKPELRAIFAAVCTLIEPYFDPANTWNGQSLQHLAFRVIREHYPEISSDDIYVLLAAARRVIRF